MEPTRESGGDKQKDPRSASAHGLGGGRDQARYYGLIEINMASKLGLPSPKPRQARWEWADIENFSGGG